MEFSSGLRNLSDGRAIKRPTWRGYVERQMVNPAEDAPNQFDATVAYTVDQKVTYNGSYYICKANTTAGTLPTDTAYWNPYTLRGEDYRITFIDRAGTKYNFPISPNYPAWAVGIYSVGDKVSYAYKYYKCIVATTAAQTANPSQDTTHWELVNVLMDVPPVYSVSKAYAVGDKVAYTASSVTKVYECIQAGTGKTPLTETSYWSETTISPTSLVLDRELLSNVIQNDWEEGAAEDFADAAATSSTSKW